MTQPELPDPGDEAVDKLLEDLEAFVFKPSEIARAARRLRAHIHALREWRNHNPEAVTLLPLKRLPRD